MLPENLNLRLSLFLSGLLNLITVHDLLNPLHHIMNIKRHADGERHLICVVDAHTKETLHGLEFSFVGLCDGSTALLVNELDDSTRHIFFLSIDWSNQEISHFCCSGLIVDFVLEFCLLRSII